ncbi:MULTISPECIES: peptidase [unclassified Micromonospora]|uniref:COG1470 family protein n=1 Tax=unclassified Micromonospora TaxID=2617518 RepID=UPI0009D1345B|nr:MULTISPECIES: peptidase [unclassified Micromonospora]OON30001.1 hypothetical protein BSA16_18550 [Micromonospora sp. Rc5]
MLLCAAGPGVPARAGAPAAEPDSRAIGIQLLEAPVARHDDPRALRYIVDHLPPGSTIKRKISVVNHSAERRRLDLYAAGADVADGKFRFAEGRTANELSGWITLDEGSVTLDPQESARFTATVRVPREASAGERYGVVWASTVPARDTSANVNIVHRVGVRVYLDVGAGGEPPSDFTIGDVVPARDGEGRPSVDVAVRNTGGRALDMGGSATLSDGPGGVRAGPFDVVQGTTLAAGEAGSVRVLFPAELADGPWRIALDLESGKVRRSASGTITFPEPGQAGRRAPLFDRLARSWWLRAGALVAAAAAIAGVALLVRRLRRRRRAVVEPAVHRGRQVAASSTGSDIRK